MSNSYLKVLHFDLESSHKKSGLLTGNKRLQELRDMVLKTRGNGITMFEEIDGKATWEFIGNSLEFTVIDKKMVWSGCSMPEFC